MVMPGQIQGQEPPRQEREERRRGLFPQDTLEAALRVTAAIHRENAGRPFNRILLAQAVDRTPASSAFRTLITSSARYGLTIGSYNSPAISLSTLGNSVEYPKSDEERTDTLVRAALTPPLFQRFYQRYSGNRVPRDDLAVNILNQEFGVPRGMAPRCLEIIRDNGRFVGIIRDVGGAEWVMLDVTTGVQLEEGPATTIEPPPQPGGEVMARAPEVPPPTSPTPTPPEEGIARVFISHGKNEDIIEQLRTMLDFGGFAYEIAEEEETTAIPVPEKVFKAMRRCNSAIINISADEQERHPDATYGINQNVLIEIGAAFVLYYPRLVLLVDRRVTLPSNLQGLYRCDYEGDELSWSVGMKLQKALAGFRGPLTPDA